MVKCKISLKRTKPICHTFTAKRMEKTIYGRAWAGLGMTFFIFVWLFVVVNSAIK